MSKYKSHTNFCEITSERQFNNVINHLKSIGYERIFYDYKQLMDRYGNARPCTIWTDKDSTIQYARRDWLEEKGYKETKIRSIVPEELFVI